MAKQTILGSQETAEQRVVRLEQEARIDIARAALEETVKAYTLGEVKLERLFDTVCRAVECVDDSALGLHAKQRMIGDAVLAAHRAPPKTRNARKSEPLWLRRVAIQGVEIARKNPELAKSRKDAGRGVKCRQTVFQWVAGYLSNIGLRVTSSTVENWWEDRKQYL